MSDEEWRPVVGYEGYYEVSDLGRVRGLDRMVRGGYGSVRLQRGRILKQQIDENGRHQVNLCRDSRAKPTRVHRVVAIAFLGDRTLEGLEVCHSDGDASNNTLANIRWDTHRENMIDNVRHGKNHLVNRTIAQGGICWSSRT